MKLSICTVNDQSEESLKSLLESLVDYPPSCLYEVVVMNNEGSKEELKRLKENFGDQLHIHSTQDSLSHGEAQNRVVKEARGEYIFLCHPDTQFDDGSCDALLDFAELQDDFGIVGPQLKTPDGTVHESCRRFPRRRDVFFARSGLSRLFPRSLRKHLMRDRDLRGEQKVDCLVGAAFLMKRKRFLDLGGFDKQLSHFFSDIDLCRRVSEAGYDVWYCPDAVFIRSSHQLLEPGRWPFQKSFWTHLRSALNYFSKWRKVH